MIKVTRFALPGHPAILIRQSMTVLPRYLLAFFAPLQAVGLFGIATRLGNVIRLFVENFHRAWNPFAFANEGQPDERRLYETVFKAVFVILLLLGTGFSLIASELIGILTPAGYEGAAPLVPGVVAALALDGLVQMLSPIIYTRERVRWSSYLAVVRLLALIALALWLVPSMAAPGLVIALVVSSFVYFVCYLLAARSLFPFSIPLARMGVLSAVAVAIVWALLQVDLPVLLGLLVKGSAALIFGLTSGLFILSSQERAQVRALVMRGR